MFGSEGLSDLQDRLIDIVEEVKGYKVFVSHDSEDEHLAREIKREAASVGVEAWLFEDDKEFGSPLRKKIQSQIEDSDAFVVLLTEKASVSAYVHQEIGYAEGSGVQVIPLVHESLKLDKLAMLQGREQIRFGDDTIGDAVTELKEYAKEQSREAAKGNVRGALGLAGLFLLLKLLPDDEDEA